MSNCYWSVLPLECSLGDHAAAWDELHQKLFRANPMLESGFVNELLVQFGAGDEHLCILRQPASAETLAMCIVRPGSPMVWRSFLPSQAQIGPSLLSPEIDLRSLIHALPGPIIELDLLCNDPDFGNLAERSFADTHSIDHALTMHIDLAGSFTNYWAQRPKKLAQNTERYRRRAGALGIQQRFATISAPDEIVAAVKRYSTLESEGWKGTQGTALGSEPAQARFYEAVMMQYAQQGRAVVWELWFDDRLTASRLAILSGTTVVMLKTTYREPDASVGPGRELLRRSIEYCFERMPGGRIEFYTDASEDQLGWSSGHRWIRHVAFYAHPFARMVAAAIRFSRRQVGPLGQGAPQGEVSITVYRHPDEFPATVLRLLSESEKISIQFSADWYRNLIDTVFMEHPGVKFYVLFHAGRPVAVLPLIAERSRLGWQLRSLSNYYSALYAPILSTALKGHQLGEMINAVKRDHPGLASIQLSPMATEDASFRTMQSALNCAGMACFPYFCFGNWFLPVNQDWDSYLRSRRSKQRNTISRMGKKFAAEGGRLELIANEDIERGLAAYQRVYAESWKVAEPFVDFMPGLIRMCAKRGWLRLGVAWLGEKPIAAQVWMFTKGKADIYKVAYDEKYKAYSPGTLLTALLLKHVMDTEDAIEIDYLIGDDPYKETWMSNRRERWGLISYNPFSIGGIFLLTREISWRSLRFISNLTCVSRPALSASLNRKSSKGIAIKPSI